jgi:hypothetical protein
MGTFRGKSFQDAFLRRKSKSFLALLRQGGLYLMSLSRCCRPPVKFPVPLRPSLKSARCVLQKECTMSYSAIGEHAEKWNMTIRVTPWRWTCTLQSPKETRLKFSFYSVMLLGGKGPPIISDVEVCPIASELCASRLLAASCSG